MGKVKVIFASGQSRFSNKGIDYMMCEVDGKELYAERDPMDYISDEDKEMTSEMSEDDKFDFLFSRYDGFETLTYEDLKADILKQAEENGISIESIDFQEGVENK